MTDKSLKVIILATVFLFSVGAATAYYFLNKGSENEIAKQWSRGKCQGSETVPLTQSPIEIAQLGSIAPMGNMVGDHVTPSDHFGFSPKNPDKQTPIHAMAKGFVVALEHSIEPNSQWYGVLIEHSCTLYSRQFLLTDLAEPFKKMLGSKTNAAVRIPVEAGQIIGSLRSHGMDYWLVDLNSKIYSINLDRYNNERGKLYITDPFKFFEEPLRSELLKYDLRTADPPGGKFNYDVDGTLAGNWFKQGYIQTDDAQKDAINTLTIGYDWLDPKIRILSIGDFGGQAKQMALKSSDPDPQDVKQDTGLVKYSLVSWSYRLADGSEWDRITTAKGIQGYTQDAFVQATVLVKLEGSRMLKLEIFPGKTATEVNGFTDKAMIYER